MGYDNNTYISPKGREYTNYIFDLLFKNGIDQPKELESQINNIPGVLENGLFVNLTDEVLVGEVKGEIVSVKSLERV